MAARDLFGFIFLSMLAAGALHAQNAVTLLELTNSWRYNQTVSYDGTNWTAPAFNDSALPSGRGLLAFETNNVFVQARTNTVLTLGRNTYYFRTHFNFSGSPTGATLTFSNVVDDGAVYHLNGVEIARLFMTNDTTPVTYATLASDHEVPATGFDSFSVSGPRIETNLVNGDNVLAMEVHQTSAGSSDIVWGCSLSVTFSELTPSPLRFPVVPPAYGYSLANAFSGLNFGQPLCIAAAPGETNRLFVLSKPGQMYIITNLASPTITTFMDLSSRLYTQSESGLLGLAFHPGYATNGYFFLFYSISTNGGPGGIFQRVARFQTSAANPNQALTNTEVILINQKDPAGNHNGGDLHFGPDGYLYFSLGDGGVQYDGSANSQRIDRDFFSAIGRIDVDSPPRPGNLVPNSHIASLGNYRIPADNPFIGRTNFDGVSVNPTNIRTEFYAVGLRNPWRFSFDPVTGFLYCGDVGQDNWEEVSVITKGGNYGWAYREALRRAFQANGVTPIRANTPVELLIDPIQEYQRGSGPTQGNSVTGGVVYRGNRLSQLIGWYVFADYVSGNIWMLRHDGTNTVPFQRIAGQTGIAAFGTDPSNGDVLMANLGGAIQRLTYNTNNASGAPIPPTLADTGAFTNLTTLTNQTQGLGASAGLLPYDINVHFWSDNARKSRWFLAATNLKTGFRPEGNWSFNNGMAWVKHFDLELTNGLASSTRRLETRFVVKNSNGVYGVTYRWGNSLTNATLVPEEGMDESFVINEGGTIRTQVWHYPGRGECMACHTPLGGFALGFNTVQMNRDFVYAGGASNQLAFMGDAGLFSNAVPELNSLRALAPATNDAASREWRVRSFLAANCAQCHQPGGAALGYWNANITNFTVDANIIDGPLNNHFGNPNARVAVPASVSNSMLHTRISTRGPMQMPPLATSVLDTTNIHLVSAWIDSGPWTNDIAPPNVSIAATNGGTAIRFIQPANRAYRVETATNLNLPVQWRFLDVRENRPFYPAASNAVSIFDSTNSGQKFYRVRWSTP